MRSLRSPGRFDPIAGRRAGARGPPMWERARRRDRLARRRARTQALRVFYVLTSHNLPALRGISGDLWVRSGCRVRWRPWSQRRRATYLPRSLGW